MHVVIPVLGRLLSGSREAYQYLPESTEHFVTAEQLAGLLSAAGFTDVHFERFMFGTIAIHSAKK
jgi:demethylmenaquinone methyltransferase/2-methoxy-6-polyprenyl-1,4-benzoquinol methylase